MVSLFISVHLSLLWTDVGLSTTIKKGPQHDFVSRPAAASTLCDVQVHAADPIGLVATVRGDHSKNKTTRSLLNENETEEKNGCISSHGDTQRNDRPHLNSAPEQAERPEIHHRILLEMLLPNHAFVKTLKKASTKEYPQ